MQTPLKVSGKDSCNLQKGKCFPNIDQRITSLWTQIVHSHERSIGLQWKVMYWPNFQIYWLSFFVAPALSVPWIFQGSLKKPYAEKEIYSFQPCYRIIKIHAYTSTLQLFLQPKLFSKRGHHLAVLQELYRWRIPFFYLNSLTHHKREKQDPRILSFNPHGYRQNGPNWPAFRSFGGMAISPSLKMMGESWI